MPLESLIRHYLYGRSIASARIRNFLVLEYGRVTDKKKKKKKKKKKIIVQYIINCSLEQIWANFQISHFQRYNDGFEKLEKNLKHSITELEARIEDREEIIEAQRQSNLSTTDQVRY